MTRSEWSKRSASRATNSGAAAMMIAASEEATCCSPNAISGNGITISTTANTASHHHRPRSEPSRPSRQLSASSTAAPSTTRTQARNAGETPSSTAILMNRYGIPQRIETAANAAHARPLTPASSGTRAP